MCKHLYFLLQLFTKKPPQNPQHKVYNFIILFDLNLLKSKKDKLFSLSFLQLFLIISSTTRKDSRGSGGVFIKFEALPYFIRHLSDIKSLYRTVFLFFKKIFKNNFLVNYLISYTKQQ